MINILCKIQGFKAISILGDLKSFIGRKICFQTLDL